MTELEDKETNFYYKESGEANHWMIISKKDNNWFMVVHFNGEISENKQKENLELVLKTLNNK
jgi:hypothetical protein